MSTAVKLKAGSATVPDVVPWTLALYLRCAIHRLLPIHVIEEIALLPESVGQSYFFMEDDLPLALVTWAMITDAKAAEIKADPRLLWQLSKNEITAGTNCWILDVVAPGFDAERTQELLAELKHRLFTGKPVTYLAVDPKGDRAAGLAKPSAAFRVL
jgi:hemolysin-activating ACP:hemolysin acyltransferase